MLSNAKLFTKMAIMQTVLMFSTMIIIPIYFLYKMELLMYTMGFAYITLICYFMKI